MFPDDVVGIQRGNAEIRPIPTTGARATRERRKKIRIEEQHPIRNTVWAFGGRRSYKWAGRDKTGAEHVRLIESMEGKRKPVILKIAKLYGNAVDRAPPYRQEAHPVGFVWDRAKGAYGARYEACSVRGYIATFSDSLGGGESPRIAARATFRRRAWP